MPWIRTIEPDDAEGRLREAHDWQSARLGRPTEFTQLGGLDAELVHACLVVYKATEGDSRGPEPGTAASAGHKPRRARTLG